MRQLLYWPNEECAVIARVFEEKFSLPYVLGAIDGSHTIYLLHLQGTGQLISPIGNNIRP